MSNEDHAWRPPADGDLRSPCPALNSLANHGYLPRDGKNLGISNITSSLGEVYNVSYPLALTLALMGIVMCGSPLKASFTLKDLALHNKAEHDASLAHADAAPGDKYAPVVPDEARLRDLLEHSPHKSTLNLEDLAKVRVDREGVLKTPLGFYLGSLAKGESVLLTLLLGDKETNEISKAQVDEFMRWDRIPEGFKRPERQISIGSQNALTKVFQAHIDQLKKKDQ